MPKAAPTPCRFPQCSAVVSPPGYCDKHKREVQAVQDKQRGSSTERGYDYRWQQASKGYIRRHLADFVCPECGHGLQWLSQKLVVDHIIPHRLKQAKDSGIQSAIDAANKLRWDRNNWQIMHEVCHGKKTAREDGGFGRPGGGQKSGAV